MAPGFNAYVTTPLVPIVDTFKVELLLPLHKIGVEEITPHVGNAGAVTFTTVDTLQPAVSVAITVYDCALNPVKVPVVGCVALGLILYDNKPDPPNAEIFICPPVGKAQVGDKIVGDENIMGTGCVIFITVLILQFPASVAVTV